MVFNKIKEIGIRMYESIPENSTKYGIRVAMLRCFSTVSRRFFVNKGDCVIQVGTPNLTLIKWYLKLLGPSGRLVVIEPEKKNFDLLQSDPTVTASPNLTLLKRAAWSKREKLSLVVSGSQYDHKVEVPEIVHDNDFVPDNYVGSELVQADTIDNVVQELGIDEIGFIEIHVNGAEIEVLKGMELSLPKTARISVKGHALLSDSKEPINKKISEILHENGFRTTLTRTSAAREEATDWSERDGDVYGERLH